MCQKKIQLVKKLDGNRPKTGRKKQKTGRNRPKTGRKRPFLGQIRVKNAVGLPLLFMIISRFIGVLTCVGQFWAINEFIPLYITYI